MTARKSESMIGLDAEARAVEEGHRAFVQPGGSIKVVSDTQRDKSYNVTFEVEVGGFIHFYCDCRGGECRPHLLIPCKHSALAGRRLEREGLAIWHNGQFEVTPNLLSERTQEADCG